ncbi:DNA polymerase III subunit beta [Desulfolithobacter dissulfuricans]|uniref:Beta sliding clamp n=1 Tax=Desulfolithobacter dissulfuricans TaxID=2795293 RepID=A0A915UBG8_9BACT|nr:DNA polymerase III subunit beta [Desulfolithobacter dissulfuricans]BCO10700.1 DNA polymerase III subunit beta [Desulfolithobacter dissulfuricans]
MAFHFNISRTDLLRAIGAQQNITSKKGTLAILSNVLLKVEQNRIIFTGTDLEIGLKQTVPAEVFEEGVLTLPAKKLFEITRESASDTLSFVEKENNWVEISAGPARYKLAGMVSDEFPAFPEFNEETLVDMEGDVLGDLIDKTIFSIAHDKENMYSLTAGLLEKEEVDGKKYLKIISSDGHRLTIMSKEVDGATFDGLTLNPVTLIPRKGVQEMRKFCEENPTFKMGIEEKQAVLKSDESLLIVRLMEGEFPDYRGILNVISRDNIININRVRFLESLKRINLFTEDMFHAIKMEIQDNNLVLTSQNADFGSAKDEFEVGYAGDPLFLGFNCRYFIDTLQVMEGDIIQAAISSDESPCLITSPDDEGFLSIIMPMKL